MPALDSLQRIRRHAAHAAMIALIPAIALLAACQRVSQPPERDVLLGGLFSLTGEWSTLGQTSKAAMEIAVEDVNRYLARNPARVRFVAAVEDTKLDPELALQRAQALKDRGAQLLIGPQSSAETARLKNFVDAAGILLVSQSSTAGTLAIAGDNIFRFTPSDTLEARAISELMWKDGIRTIVPLWRDDEGNLGLVTATRAVALAKGGAVLEGVGYDADEGDLGDVVSRLSAQVRRAVARRGARQVGIYFAGFDEAVTLFRIASSDPLLRSVHWYGSDGMAFNKALIADTQAAQFAIRVGYPTPVFGRDEGARDIWEPLARQIRSRTNLEPDAFAFAVYDAVWVVARGYIASGATLGIDELKRAFTTAARSGYGATGWTVLNEAGDRKYGDFDFWAVRTTNGAPGWTRVARYETRTGTLVR